MSESNLGEQVKELFGGDITAEELQRRLTRAMELRDSAAQQCERLRTAAFGRGGPTLREQLFMFHLSLAQHVSIATPEGADLGATQAVRVATALNMTDRALAQARKHWGDDV